MFDRELSTIDEESEDAWSGTSGTSETSTEMTTTSSRTRSKILRGTKIEKAVKACQSGNITLLKTLQIAPNQLDDEECGLLHWAAINNQIEIIEYLLTKGANINVIGGNLKSTPLHWACHVGHLEAVVTLILNGADPSIRNINGETALHVAAQTGNSVIISYILIKADRIKDARDKFGQSALLIAARNCYGMFPIKIFVFRRAHLDFADDLKGETALHISVRKQNHLGAVELLVGGADYEKRNQEGKTALQLTSQKSAKSLKKLTKNTYLKRFGTKKMRFFSNWGFEMLFSASIIGITVILFFLATYFIHMAAGFAVLAIMIALIFGIYYKKPIQHMMLLPVSYIQTLGFAEFGILIFYTNGIIPWYILVPTILLWAISGLVFWTLLFWNPGVIAYPEKPYDEFIKKIESGSKDRWCFTCWIPKTQNSHHCSICDRCVHDFDHHCPWIYKCVYQKNMKLFLSFLILTLVCCYVYSIIVGFCIYHHVVNEGALHVFLNETILLTSFIFSIFHIFGASTIVFTQFNQVSRFSHGNPNLALDENLTLGKRIGNVVTYFVTPTRSPKTSATTFSTTTSTETYLS